MVDFNCDVVGPVPSAAGLGDALLVGIDFSPASIRALEAALRWRPPRADVIGLHVVDSDEATRLEQLGLWSFGEAVANQRACAERKLAELLERGAFDPMIVEGVPFAEIIKVAADLECDLIVLGSPRSSLQFGGTAETVLRATSQAVLCVP